MMHFLFTVRPALLADLQGALQGSRYHLTPTTCGRQMVTLASNAKPTPEELAEAARLVANVSRVEHQRFHRDVASDDWARIEWSAASLQCHSSESAQGFTTT
jgi:hypothetical protein